MSPSRPTSDYRFVAHAPASRAPRPVVIGTGPCGLFAALVLAQMGFRPIILERGKVVRERTKDTWGLWRKRCSIRNRTCSSAKAAPARSPTASSTARSRTRRHHGRKVLTEFVKAGAPEEILYVSQAAHRHLPAGDDGREHARDDRGARRRDPLRQPASTISRSTDADGSASVRGVVLARRRRMSRPITSCWRSATARATPSRCCTRAASTSRPSRSRSASASSIRSR